MRFINFAIQPEQQAALAEVIPYGPTNANAIPLLDPELAKSLPSYPDNLAKGVLFNDAWWADNLDMVKQKWDAWLLQ
jgi:putative spermidine/putrescine transport system substrate-binding protein